MRWLTRQSASNCAAALMVSAGLYCSGCSETASRQSRQAEDYHADNDIAMTVRSVSDAFSVGEPLHDSDYRFEGVLTDGTGMPLYTDVMGSPGQWQVEVVSETMLRIHNIYLGDLLPANLTQYLVQTLDLGEPRREGQVVDAEGDEVEITEYSLPGSGTMRIETSEATAPNGTVGPLVSILLFNG